VRNVATPVATTAINSDKWWIHAEKMRAFEYKKNAGEQEYLPTLAEKRVQAFPKSR